ncbi:hypothetical protein [Pseudarthrobacter sp. MEB009]|uniref:hypothetical protein n=1 Tax=Pseudarthrobacter sp. MEB009 TaxID=3040326 RepID=UPI002554821D|nr:hypothetical protein [Pseudarthrobacter sp. MEB009]
MAAPSDGFVTAVPPNGGEKRRVPIHYLDEPFNYRLPPSQRVEEPAQATPATARITEPARPEKTKEV